MAYDTHDFALDTQTKLEKFGFSFHSDAADTLPVPGCQPEVEWWWCLGEPVFPNIITSEETFDNELGAVSDALHWWLNNSIFSDEA